MPCAQQAVVNLKSGIRITERDYFYDNEYDEVHNEEGVYKTKAAATADIIMLANAIGGPRIALGFISASTGSFFFGDLTVKWHGRNGVNLNHPTARSLMERGMFITDLWIRRDYGLTDVLLENNSPVTTIIAVEDEHTYLRVCRLAARKGWIVVYMKGCPDVSTRALLLYLQDRFQVPVGAVVDLDTGGLISLRTIMDNGPRSRVAVAEEKYKLPYVRWYGPLPSHTHPLLPLGYGLRSRTMTNEYYARVEELVKDGQSFVSDPVPLGSGFHLATRTEERLRELALLKEKKATISTSGLTHQKSDWQFEEAMDYMIVNWV